MSAWPSVVVACARTDLTVARARWKGERMDGVRESSDEYREGRLWAGYDYDRQVWVVDGRYVDCGHPAGMDCQCYGRVHAGEQTVAWTMRCNARPDGRRCAARVATPRVAFCQEHLSERA